MENCDICANDVFRDSWTANRASSAAPSSRRRRCGPSRRVKPKPAAAGSNGAIDQEALVKTITDRVMAALTGK